MAGKWHLFQSAIQSVLEGETTVRRYLKKLGLSLWLGLFFCGLLLTSAAVPALSQTGLLLSGQGNKTLSVVRGTQISQSVDSTAEADMLDAGRELLEQGQRQLQQGQISSALESWKAAEQHYRQQGNNSGILHSQLFQTEALRKLGFYPQACQVLVQIMEAGDTPEISRSQSICQDQENVKELLDQPGRIFQEQSDRFKVAVQRNLGVVFRGLGRLKESEMILSNKLGANDPATLLSLGNTLRAQGNLVRDRITSPNYDAMPWRFEKLTSLDEDDVEDVRTSLADCSISQLEADGGVACETQLEHKDESYAKVAAFYQTAKNNYQLAKLNHEDASRSLEVKAKLNQLVILSDLMRLSGRVTNISLVGEAEGLINQILEGVDTLPDGQERIFAQINLAKQWTFLKAYVGDLENLNGIESLLCQADRDAIELTLGNQANACNAITESADDPSNFNFNIRSYTLGSLGGFYEYHAWLVDENTLFSKKQDKAGNLRKQAISFTEQALLLAQPADAPDAAYQWQWQIGRLQAAQDHREDAISNYEQALETLSTVRKDLIGTTRTTQFSFRDNVEPVYRQLIDLKLTSQEPSQQDLRDAVNLVDFLQIAELENFFNCNLSQIAKLDREVVDPKAAIIYPIFLDNRIEIILSLPNKGFYREYHDLELNEYEANKLELDAIDDIPGTVEELIRGFEKKLKSPSKARGAQLDAEVLYDIVIRPIEDNIKLSENQIETLVFVSDGEFRNIPMAPLRDRISNEFLIEKYAIASVTGLNLITSEKLPRNPSILMGGSEKTAYNPLTNARMAVLEIQSKIETIKKYFNSYKILQAKDFSLARIKQSMERKIYNIVHFETHGYFSSNPDRTFILLEDEVLYISDLERLLNSQLDTKNGLQLLVLSACKTADGDRHATLGMAGLTIRSGARSTLATLWSIYENESQELFDRFYEYINEHPKSSKAKALQEAQIHMLKAGDDFNWSPFILVGNWL